MTLADLTSTRINGTLPFPSHGDVVSDCLREARAMLIVMESAYRTSSDIAHKHGDGDVDTINLLNDDIKADALEGIGSLLALAEYCRAQAAAEREADLHVRAAA